MNRVVRSTSVPIAERSSADDQIAFPVAGHGTVLDLGGPLADHHLGRDVRPGLLPGARPRHPQRPPGAQAGDQLALERAAALDVERLVDRLVADPHGLIIGEVDLAAAARSAPGSTPCTHRRSSRCGLLRPFHARRGRPRHRRPVRRRGPRPTSRSCTYSRSRSLATSFAGLGAPRQQLGLPLRDRRPVVEPAAAGRRVAAQLPRDRRRARGPAAARSRAPRSLCAFSSAISSRSANDR